MPVTGAYPVGGERAERVMHREMGTAEVRAQQPPRDILSWPWLEGPWSQSTGVESLLQQSSPGPAARILRLHGFSPGPHPPCTCGPLPTRQWGFRTGPDLLMPNLQGPPASRQLSRPQISLFKKNVEIGVAPCYILWGNRGISSHLPPLPATHPHIKE